MPLRSLWERHSFIDSFKYLLSTCRNQALGTDPGYRNIVVNEISGGFHSKWEERHTNNIILDNGKKKVFNKKVSISH